MDSTSIKTRAITSGKWLVIISVISMLFTYGTNAILGKIAPDLLGRYSIVNMYLSTLSTFVGMGGATVFSTFIPKIKSMDDKVNFFYTYSLITFIMYMFFSILFLFFPSISKIFVGEMSFNLKLFATLFVGSSYVAMTIISYLLISILEARISNVMNKLYNFFLPIVIVFILFVDKDFLYSNIIIVVFLVITFSCLIGIIIGTISLKKDFSFHKNFKFYMNFRIIKFMIISYMQSVFTFLYNNIDKMFIIALGTLGELGYYQAVLTMATLLDFIPSLMSNVTIPYFSTIIATKNISLINESYHKIEKYMVGFTSTVSIMTLIFSKFLMLLFGIKYVEYSYLLVIYAIGKCIGSQSCNTSLLIAFEYNKIRFINSLLQILIQFVISIILFDQYGVLALVWAKVIGLGFAQIIPRITLINIKEYKFKLPKAYSLSVIISLILGLLWLLNIDYIYFIFLGLIIYFLFVFLSGYTIAEVRTIIRIFCKKN